MCSAGGWSDKATTNLGLRSTFDTKFSVNNDISLSGITGIETQRQNASTIGYGMIDPTPRVPPATTRVWNYGDPYFIIGSTAAGANGITSDVYTATSTTSLFTEWTLALPHDFSITGGIGMSNMNITLDDRLYVANKPTHFDTTYKSMFSPHLAINKVFSKQFSVYAAYSRAYKAPVSSYFFIPYASGNVLTGIVNKNLKPEVGDQFEVGTKGALLNGKLSYQLAFFDATFSNKMTAIAVPNPANTATLFTYVVNGGKHDDKGIEVLVKYTAFESSDGFFKSITPFVNFTYSDFKYKDFIFQSTTKTINAPVKDSIVIADYSGHAVPGVAKVVVNLGFDIATRPGLYANMTYFYKDPLPVTSDGLVNKVPYMALSYSLLNAKLGFRKAISSHFDLDVFGGANNITNSKYPKMIFVNQIPDAYIAGPRFANYYGGLNLKYNFN